MPTNNRLVYVDASCWIVGLLNTTILILSIFYTLGKLKQMYPNANNAMVKEETTKITLIAAVFGLAFLVKSAFEWTLLVAYNRAGD